MMYIGDEVEISFEKGGECAVTYQDNKVHGILEIEMLLTPDSNRRSCKIWLHGDMSAQTLQKSFAAEMVKAGFSLIWEEVVIPGKVDEANEELKALMKIEYPRVIADAGDAIYYKSE